MNFPKSITRAFTILELLVATAVLAVIMGILFAIFGKASDTWVEGEAVVNRQSNARLTMELFTREISHALITTGTASTAVKFIGNSNAVYFVAPVNPAIDYVSDLAEYGYVYSPNANAPTNLVRYYTEPTTANASTWNIREDLELADVPLSASKFAAANILADTLFGFKLAYYGTNGSGGLETVSYTWDSHPISGNKPNRLPAVIELTLVVMDSRHAGHVAKIPVGSIRTEFINRHTRTNIAVIYLQHAL